MKRQNTPAAEEPAKKKHRRRATDPKTGLTVFEPNTVYFNDYLETYIGAKWQAIKNSLYDAGYQDLEVSRYRDGLLRSEEHTSELQSR